MLVTVFTPTYNRANTIGRTFKSLLAQTVKDFEWLVVDDGSTDSTIEVIEGFKAESFFPIRLIKKSNGGKHTAYNLALTQAHGQLFFTVDSDDWLPADSIARVTELSQIVFQKKLAGIITLKNYDNGKSIGKPFIKESDILTLREIENSGQAGERSIILVTSIARKEPFPVIEGERFMTEAVVYDKFYDLKFVVTNDALTICEYQPDGLSSNPKSLMMKNPAGFMLFYRTRIDLADKMKDRIGYVLRYNTFRALSLEKGLEPYKGRYNLLIRILDIFTPLVVRHYRKSVK